MDASAPGSLLQQSERVSRALLDLLLLNLLVSDGSVTGHATVSGDVGGHHCRCAEAPEVTTVTPAHKDGFHVCTPKYQGGMCFLDLSWCCVQLPGQKFIAVGSAKVAAMYQL